MVRKQIYISNHQERFLKSLNRKESDVIREAIDRLMEIYAMKNSAVSISSADRVTEAKVVLKK